MSTVFLDEVENCATALAGHRAALLFTFSLSERQIPIQHWVLHTCLETKCWKLFLQKNSAMTQIQPQGNPYLKLMDLTNAIVLADGKVLDGSGTSSGSLTVIVTGTTLTEGSFPNWDNSYMTLVNEG